MKNYAIYDEGLDRKTAVGYLFYYEKAQQFIIELCRDLDEWDAPILFQGLVKEGIYTVPKDISLLWVKERVIPSGRQNIGAILKNHKLKEYSEMALLQLSRGRCSQDSCYIEEVSEDGIPTEIQNRTMKNVLDCFPTADGQIICMFRDNRVRKIELSQLENKYEDISYVLRNEELRNCVKVGVGGYSITFNDSIEISALDLRKAGVLLPLTAEDFSGYVRRTVIDTTKACEMLGCSRQNLAYLIKGGRIAPIILGTKENLYARCDIERLMGE